MTKAYSYLRFSTPEQAKGDSQRRQSDLARDYAERHRLELDQELTFQDLGVSAFRGANAETGRLGDFLRAVDEGLVERGSVLLVESLDRISRATARKALRVLEDIVDRGITVVTLGDGRVYNTANLDDDPTSLLLSLLVFMRANEESATKSRRLKAVNQTKRDDARESRKLLTRRLPAWLEFNEDTKAIEVIPEKAKVVAEIFDWANAGFGKDAIARRLNERGEPTFGTAAHWQRSYIEKILNNPATIGTHIPRTRDVIEGKVQRKAQEPIEGYFPPVVDRELFHTIQSIKETRAPRGRYSAQSVTSVFTGLTSCALCGSSFVRANKGKYSYLVCSKANAKGGCEYLAVPYGQLEETLRRNITSFIESIPRGESVLETEKAIEALREELSDKGSVLEFLVDEFSRQRSPTIRERINKQEKEVEALQERLRELTKERENNSPSHIQKRIERLREVATREPWDTGEVNRALRQNIKELRINPAHGTIEVQWQTGRWNSESLPFYSRHIRLIDAEP